MRILFVCHRFPFPPNRGGKIRPFNIIKHLSAHHEVIVASLARSEQEAKDGAPLESYCSEYHMERVHAPVQTARMLARLPTPQPSSMGYFYSRRLAHRIREIARRQPLDLVFVHCSSMAGYVTRIPAGRKLLDFGDMDSQKWLDYSKERPFPLSIGYWLEGQKLQRAEARLAAQFDVCTTTTRAELDTLQSYRVPVTADWFPNGVDFGYFHPAENYDRNLISFIGRMDYYPNQACMIEFCRNTLPLLQQRFPSLRLVIVGANPSRAIRALGELAGVTVTGGVPDVRPYVQQSVAMVAPLSIARGTQNKILESMAMGVPVICSKLAGRGVDAVDGEHLLTADRPSEYADALARVIEDRATRERLSRAGRARVLTHHAWEGSMARLDAILEKLAGQEPRAQASRRDSAATPLTR